MSLIRKAVVLLLGMVALVDVLAMCVLALPLLGLVLLMIKVAGKDDAQRGIAWVTAWAGHKKQQAMAEARAVTVRALVQDRDRREAERLEKQLAHRFN